MSMAITTTTNIHSFQSGWRPLYMINHTNVESMQNTATKGICPWHIQQTLTVLEILVKGNPGYSNLGCRIFQA